MSGASPLGTGAATGRADHQPIDVITIEGGHAIHGEIAVRGAKNSISKQLVASLLTDQPTVLHNVPAISDTFIVSDMLRDMGVEVDADHDGAGTVAVHANVVNPLTPDRLHLYTNRSRIPRGATISFRYWVGAAKPVSTLKRSVRSAPSAGSVVNSPKSV
jgi:5-enolpyruvylshikimate-3-phosphate synthase